MHWKISKTTNGAIISVIAEPNDDEESVQSLRSVRKNMAEKSGVIEKLDDEISFFIPVDWN